MTSFRVSFREVRPVMSVTSPSSEMRVGGWSQYILYSQRPRFTISTGCAFLVCLAEILFMESPRSYIFIQPFVFLMALLSRRSDFAEILLFESFLRKNYSWSISSLGR